MENTRGIWPSNILFAPGNIENCLLAVPVDFGLASCFLVNDIMHLKTHFDFGIFEIWLRRRNGHAHQTLIEIRWRSADSKSKHLCLEMKFSGKALKYVSMGRMSTRMSR